MYRDFSRSGWTHGLDPNIWFSTTGYLTRYPDIEAKGINPWLHFMRRGSNESRSWLEVESNNEEVTHFGPQTLKKTLEIVAAKLVDPDYYFSANTDVREQRLDAISHYMNEGWREGRAPNAWLNPKYLNSHAPVLLPQHANPLVKVLELTTGFARAQSNEDSFWIDEQRVVQALSDFPRSGQILIIIHAYYPDMLNEMAPYLEILKGRAVMLITTPEQGVEACQEWAESSNWNATVLASINRGRDWGPFIGLTNLLPDLEFKSILKLHTKRSPHRDDGNQWLHHLLNGLLCSEESVERVLQEMETSKPEAHIFAASGSLVPIGDWLETSASSRAIDFARNQWPDSFSSFEYPAGSMFWMHRDVWKALGQLGLSAVDFEPELGQLDGTLSHALERHVAVKTIILNSSIGRMFCS